MTCPHLPLAGPEPNHRISGGKVLKRSSRKVVNPLIVALRLAARTLLKQSQRLGSKTFGDSSQKSECSKPSPPWRGNYAVLIYRMLKYGTQYVDKGMQHYEAKYQATKAQYLRAQVAKLGMFLLA
jgi:transposase